MNLASLPLWTMMAMQQSKGYKENQCKSDLDGIWYLSLFKKQPTKNTKPIQPNKKPTKYPHPNNKKPPGISDN